MNCSTLCVGWYLSLSLCVFLHDFFRYSNRIQKILPSTRYQDIQHQVTLSLAIGPTPGLGPSQRCSGGNNFSRTCRKNRPLNWRSGKMWSFTPEKILPVPQSSNKFGACSASTHLKEVMKWSEVPNRSLPCRCAVTDVLFPKPSWKMRFGKQNTSVQHFSAAIRIQQSLLNKTNATLTRTFCTTLLFKTLNYRSLRDCNTPFLLHFTCAILATFPEGKNSQSITSLCSRRKGTPARQSCKPQQTPQNQVGKLYKR